MLSNLVWRTTQASIFHRLPLTPFNGSLSVPIPVKPNLLRGHFIPSLLHTYHVGNTTSANGDAISGTIAAETGGLLVKESSYESQ